MRQLVCILGTLCVCLCPAAVVAQSGAPASTGSPQAPPATFTLPVITVVAQKEPAPLEKIPASVTAVVEDTILGDGLIAVSDASIFAPNTFYSDLSARKVSNARFRGVGSSPANPSVTTFIDGVPQLNANTANIDLLGVQQIEFVRGAQSALFGRNTLGGVVNVVSVQPSLSRWTGRVTAPFGSDSDFGLQAAASGPISGDRVGAGVAIGYGRRDGFTVNTVTGNTVDDRSSFAAKGQLFFKNAGGWQAHVIVSGERDRDGDYALADLNAIRANPFVVARDFEGHTDRDVVSATLLARREGERFTLTSTTGLVDWGTFDETDLDYTQFPAVTRANREDATQFTQEVRVASAAKAPVRLSDAAALSWQGGVFFFTQKYTQSAVNNFAPFVLSPQLPLAVTNHSPDADLDDAGIGMFGHGTVTFNDRFDVSAGVRFDYENKSADLQTFFVPAVGPGSVVDTDRSFSAVSPQFSVVFRPADAHTIYGSVGRGFKAGGFNPTSPAGSEAYGEEGAWHVEGGVKSVLAGGRVTVNGAVFSIDWTDLQVNLPNLSVPGQFYIANVGDAASRGAEFEVRARALEQLDVFAAVGFTHGRFKEGSVSTGIDVSDNLLPSTPGHTATFGAVFTQPLGSLSFFARGEVANYGAFKYDDLNRAGQDAYSLTNLRGGVRFSNRTFVEAWIRNAFDTRYVPVAFPYDPGSAPSGFLGEPGKPRTFGARVGVTW